MKKPLIPLLVILPFLFLLPHPGEGCEYCNKQYLEKIRKEKKNDPVYKEVLRQISQQEVQSSNFQGVPENPKGVPAPPLLFAPPSPPKTVLLPDTGFIPQDEKTPARVKAEIEMRDNEEIYLGNGVVYRGFNINGKIPGPTIVAEEGDIIEFVVKNAGSVPHGMSIHAAYTQTSKYLGRIQPGETRRFKFKATYPGVYMYHCAPGGHAIPMHTFFGQYGMIVVKPKTQKYRLEEILNKKPDVEIYLLQHEIYSSGKNAVEGAPLYVMFNGKIHRYVEEPISVQPGDFVRIYFLNVGPNIISTLHIVGVIWDFAYWEGNPSNILVGGQQVLAGPTGSWVVEFRVPEDEGAYLLVTHAFGSATRGAIGILSAKRGAKRNSVVLAEGPTYTQKEMKEFLTSARRIVSTFEPGSEDLDPPYVAEGKKAVVKIVGNSYYPKVLQIKKGTTVTWINEDTFSYLEGEFAGIHNVLAYKGPESFSSPLLSHAEKWSYTFTKEGSYDYMCTPHPYMKGRVIVTGAEVSSSEQK